MLCLLNQRAGGMLEIGIGLLAQTLHFMAQLPQGRGQLLGQDVQRAVNIPLQIGVKGVMACCKKTLRLCGDGFQAGSVALCHALDVLCVLVESLLQLMQALLGHKGLLHVTGGEDFIDQGGRIAQILVQHADFMLGGGLCLQQSAVLDFNALNLPGGIGGNQCKGNAHGTDQQHDFGSQAQREALAERGALVLHIQS